MTKIDDIQAEILKALKDYANVLQVDIDESTDRVTKDTVRILKGTSPRSNINHEKYANSWTRKKTKGGYVVYNRKYQLTHLLEKGHAKVNGGRTRKFPHIKPAEELAIEQFEKEIRKAATRK